MLEAIGSAKGGESVSQMTECFERALSVARRGSLPLVWS